MNGASNPYSPAETGWEAVGITKWSDYSASRSNHSFQEDMPLGRNSFDNEEVKSDPTFSTHFNHSNSSVGHSIYAPPFEEQQPISYAPQMETAVVTHVNIPQPKGSYSLPEDSSKPILFSLPAQESPKVFSPTLPDQPIRHSVLSLEQDSKVSYAPPEIDSGPRLYGLPVESQSVRFSLTEPSSPLSYNAPVLNDYVVSYAPQGHGIIGESPSQSVLAELLRLQDEEFSSYFYAEDIDEAADICHELVEEQTRELELARERFRGKAAAEEKAERERVENFFAEQEKLNNSKKPVEIDRGDLGAARLAWLEKYYKDLRAERKNAKAILAKLREQQQQKPTKKQSPKPKPSPRPQVEQPQESYLKTRVSEMVARERAKGRERLAEMHRQQAEEHRQRKKARAAFRRALAKEKADHITSADAPAVLVSPTGALDAAGLKARIKFYDRDLEFPLFHPKADSLSNSHWVGVVTVDSKRHGLQVRLEDMTTPEGCRGDLVFLPSEGRACGYGLAVIVGGGKLTFQTDAIADQPKDLADLQHCAVGRFSDEGKLQGSFVDSRPLGGSGRFWLERCTDEEFLRFPQLLHQVDAPTDQRHRDAVAVVVHNTEPEPPSAAWLQFYYGSFGNILLITRKKDYAILLFETRDEAQHAVEYGRFEILGKDGQPVTVESSFSITTELVKQHPPPPDLKWSAAPNKPSRQGGRGRGGVNRGRGDGIRRGRAREIPEVREPRARLAKSDQITAETQEYEQEQAEESVGGFRGRVRGRGRGRGGSRGRGERQRAEYEAAEAYRNTRGPHEVEPPPPARPVLTPRARPPDTTHFTSEHWLALKNRRT